MSRKGVGWRTPLSTTLITPRCSTTNSRVGSYGGAVTRSGRSNVPMEVNWRPVGAGGGRGGGELVGGGAGFGLPTTSVPFMPRAAWPATVHRYESRAGFDPTRLFV